MKVEWIRKRSPEYHFPDTGKGCIWSEQTGLPAGIPVAAGMFDVNACGIASGLCSEKELCM